MNDIRKISVGKDYPNVCIHYQVGKKIRLQAKEYTVHEITVNEKLKESGSIGYDIYLRDEDSVLFWKTIKDMPTVIENNIDFE